MTSHRDGRRRSPPRNVLGARNDRKVQKHRKATPSASEPRRGVTITYKAAPPGFIYVPLGTPDLAQRCKELSQQLQYPWKFVNALPTSKVVTDPAKISFHIQRIGYHFSTHVVDQACQELDYQLMGREYVTKADRDKRAHDATIAKAMEKIGYTAAKPTDSIEKVNAVILELFPCIPDHDRSRVLEHSFNPGTDRVGSMSGDLARRVQLSVVASIRHNHTDYDSLLKTFRDWNKARHEVEPFTLQKVIEWRGELQPGQHYIVEDADLSSSSDEQAKPAKFRDKKKAAAAQKRDIALLYEGDSDLADGSWHVSESELTHRHAKQWPHVEPTAAETPTPPRYWPAGSHQPVHEPHIRRMADTTSTSVAQSIEQGNGYEPRAPTSVPHGQPGYHSDPQRPRKTIEEEAAAWALYHTQRITAATQVSELRRGEAHNSAYPQLPVTQPVEYAGIRGQTQAYASYQGQQPVPYPVPRREQPVQYAGSQPVPYPPGQPMQYASPHQGQPAQYSSAHQGPPTQYPSTHQGPPAPHQEPPRHFVSNQAQPTLHAGNTYSQSVNYAPPPHYTQPVAAYPPSAYPPQPAYPPAGDRRAYDRY